ncbi:MAG: bacterial transcriptional activator domain-containing protein [Candidatus Manganitrophaceae bacterium]
MKRDWAVFFIVKNRDLNNNRIKYGVPGIPEFTEFFFPLSSPFLDRERDVSSALSLRERLRSRFLRALEKCGRFYGTEQAWPKVIDCHLQALEVEPLAERCYRDLMIAYHSVGRWAEGLRYSPLSRQKSGLFKVHKRSLPWFWFVLFCWVPFRLFVEICPFRHPGF